MDLRRKILECSKLPCWHIAYSRYVLAKNGKLPRKTWKLARKRVFRKSELEWESRTIERPKGTKTIQNTRHMHLSYWNIYRLSTLRSADTRKISYIYTRRILNFRKLHKNTRTHRRRIVTYSKRYGCFVPAWSSICQETYAIAHTASDYINANLRTNVGNSNIERTTLYRNNKRARIYLCMLSISKWHKGEYL